VRLLRAVDQGETLCWSDVATDETLGAYRARREMESLFDHAPMRQRVA
jgi:hypothetical protein